jgi:hypothetical protein
MRVNGVPFFMTISTKLHLGTCARLDSTDPKTLLTAVNNAIKLYGSYSFQVAEFRADGKFECLRHDLPPDTTANICEGKHIPEIARYIRTVKERCSSAYNTLPFAAIPPSMTAELVAASVFWLNCVPSSHGMSRTLSPRQLFTGDSIDLNEHCSLKFGTYVQTHGEHNSSMKSRTAGAIALRPVNDRQGGYLFYSLKTGRRLLRHVGGWTVVPMPQSAINNVRDLAKDAPAGITFDDYPDDPDDDSSGDDPCSPSAIGPDASLDDNFFAPLAEANEDDNSAAEEGTGVPNLVKEGDAHQESTGVPSAGVADKETVLRSTGVPIMGMNGQGIDNDIDNVGVANTGVANEPSTLCLALQFAKLLPSDRDADTGQHKPSSPQECVGESKPGTHVSGPDMDEPVAPKCTRKAGLTPTHAGYAVSRIEIKT